MAAAIKLNLEQVMAELEAMGTAQNRKIYARHGAPPQMFGVSFANLGLLTKRIKVDHELALGLWGTGNLDARMLATMIADPAQLTREVANDWVRTDGFDMFSGLLAHLMVRAPWADEARRVWIASSEEPVRRTGWAMVGATLKANPGRISDEECVSLIGEIETRIHSAPNKTRDGLNWTLIAIGCAKPHLAALATEAAGRIGKVEVDHGETGCKTPDAAAYIARTLARKAARGKK